MVFLSRYIVSDPRVPFSPLLYLSGLFQGFSRFFSFSSFFFLFLYSFLRLHFFLLFDLRLLLSFTMPSTLTKGFADYRFSVGKAAFTRSCIVCSRPVEDRCDPGNKFAPIDVPDLYLRERHHLTCSRACWSNELTNESCSYRVSVLGPDAALAGFLKELAPPSTSPRKEDSSSAPLCPPKSLAAAFGDTCTDFLEVGVSTSVFWKVSADIHVTRYTITI